MSVTPPWMKAYKETVRALIDEAKNKPCMDCGGVFPPYVIELDHRDPAKKSFAISSGNQGIAKTLEELAKCDPVCGNCHNTRTYRRKTKASGAL